MGEVSFTGLGNLHWFDTSSHTNDPEELVAFCKIPLHAFEERFIQVWKRRNGTYDVDVHDGIWSNTVKLDAIEATCLIYHILNTHGGNT